MANEKHLKILRKGVKAWNEWRRKNLNIRPDLYRAPLSNRKLSDINLTDADCCEADLKGADLFDAELSGALFLNANLRGANLSATELGLTNLTLADLRGANLSDADLGFTNFNMTKLDRADFTNAELASTTFSNVDLSKVIGLETVKHSAPSFLSIETLYRSNGRITDAFLRGCGLSDEAIAFVRSIAANPIQFNSCFISYSTKDQAFADQLYSDLQDRSVRCWFAPQDVKAGKKLQDQIDWAIHYHDRTLLILSPDSINSAWVRTEIAKARKREVEEDRQILFPIRLVDFETLKKWQYFDGDTGTDYAKEIREYFIPDFSNWIDTASYQKAFKDLLRDLKNERTKAAPKE